MPKLKDDDFWPIVFFDLCLLGLILEMCFEFPWLLAVAAPAFAISYLIYERKKRTRRG